MTITEAILKVMRDKGVPITALEVYNEIVNQNLYNFGAKDPSSVVRMEIRRQCLGIDWKSSRAEKVFKLCEGGTYEPNENFQQIDPVNISVGEEVLDEPIRDQIRSLSSEHKEQFIEEVIESLNLLTPKEFEKFSRDLLAAYGLQKVEVTNCGSDGGIDGNAKLPAGITTLNVSFQCKRWKASVGSP
jgi:restriction system protein